MKKLFYPSKFLVSDLLPMYAVSFVSFAEPKGAETLASRDSSSTISAQTSTMVTVSTLMSLLLGWISH